MSTQTASGHTEKDLSERKSLVHCHLAHQDDYLLSLADLSFPEHLIKVNQHNGFLYVELECSRKEEYIHILGTDYVQVFGHPLTQESCQFGKSLAWTTYEMSNEYLELLDLQNKILISKPPKLWIRSEFSFFLDYLSAFCPIDFNTRTEFIEVNYFADYFVNLTFLNFGVFHKRDSRYLFEYPRSCRQALKACCDIDYLKAWKESTLLNEALPIPVKTEKKRIQKI